jgi:hypothetical protein
MCTKEHVAPNLVLGLSRCLIGHLADFRVSSTTTCVCWVLGLKPYRPQSAYSYQSTWSHLAICWAEAVCQPA